MQVRLLLLADAGALFEQPDDDAIDALACVVHLPPDDLTTSGGTPRGVIALISRQPTSASYRRASFLNLATHAGPKLTHQTSPRFIGDVPQRALRPFSGLVLPLLIRAHCPVGLEQVLGKNIRPHRCFDELTDLLASDHAVESLVNLFIYGNRQLFVHIYVSHTRPSRLQKSSPG